MTVIDLVSRRRAILEARCQRAQRILKLAEDAQRSNAESIEQLRTFAQTVGLASLDGWRAMQSAVALDGRKTAQRCVESAQKALNDAERELSLLVDR